jgi:uncharacterized membrane protein YraQ (UPF0718 family)
VDRILISLAVCTAFAYLAMAFVRPDMAAKGFDATAEMFVQSIPWIIVSLFAAGLISQFFQTAVIARWLGRESGFGGIVVGALLGMCGTGSRWAMYPIAASLLAAEASPGSVFAFVTSWQLLALPRLPAEIPFYGVRFAILRAIVSLLIAIIGGVILERIAA